MVHRREFRGRARFRPFSQGLTADGDPPDGYCPNDERSLAVWEPDGTKIIEDTAEALGSTVRGKMAGSIGVMSFNGYKIMTTSGGGALVGSDDLVERVKHLPPQAWQSEVFHEHVEVGYNDRMSNRVACTDGQEPGDPSKVC